MSCTPGVFCASLFALCFCFCSSLKLAWRLAGVVCPPCAAVLQGVLKPFSALCFLGVVALVPAAAAVLGGCEICFGGIYFPKSAHKKILHLTFWVFCKRDFWSNRDGAECPRCLKIFFSKVSRSNCVLKCAHEGITQMPVLQACLSCVSHKSVPRVSHKNLTPESSWSLPQGFLPRMPNISHQCLPQPPTKEKNIKYLEHIYYFEQKFVAKELFAKITTGTCYATLGAFGPVTYEQYFSHNIVPCTTGSSSAVDAGKILPRSLCSYLPRQIFPDL